MDTTNQFEKRLEKSHNLEEKVMRIVPFVGTGALMGLGAGYVFSENQDNLKYLLSSFVSLPLINGAIHYRQIQRNPAEKEYHLMRLKDDLLFFGSAMAGVVMYYF